MTVDCYVSYYFLFTQCEIVFSRMDDLSTPSFIIFFLIILL